MFDRTLQLLADVFKRLPAGARAPIKRAVSWSLLRGQALMTLRPVHRGRRVEFVDYEIADLEDFEFIGPGSGEVLVRAQASCVSPGTERAVLCGLPGARRSFAYVPGYSSAGIVVHGRSGNIGPGDLVAGRMSHASHGVMTGASLFKVPAGVTAEQASFIELGIISLQGIRKAGIRPGDRVAVVGQGLIGQLATRLARIVGAQQIIAVATSRRRATSAVGSNAADELVVLSEKNDFQSRIQADVVIEAVGNADAIRLAMAIARCGGTVSLLGSSRDLGRDLDWWSMAQQRRITLVGAHISAMPRVDASTGLWTYAQEGRLFLQLLATGRLEISDLITWRAQPDECNQVYEVIAEGGRQHVAIVFDWERTSARGATEDRGGN
jgi:2-desacetyl-2-hydroxyethyl bacteriochlorophyllide A dehydrogenase